MPMKGRCSAAAPCRCAATVRQLQTQDEWWEAAGCVDHTERVQLQLHAKLVAIQTEAPPAVQSTQPADALHVICVIHTVSRFHCASLDARAMARNVCLDQAGCVDCTAGRASVWIATSFACHCSCTRSVRSTQPAASHHSSCVCNCLTVAAQRHGVAALHWAFMGIK
jgi:hypothetical protein